MHNDTIKKSWYKRWWAITLFAIIGLVILANLFGGNNTSNSSSSDNGGIKATPEEAKTYSIGDSIQAGDFTWKITKSSTATEIGEDLMGTFFGEKADGIFIILDVEVTNTGKSAIQTYKIEVDDMIS